MVVFALISQLTYGQNSCASYQYQQEQIQKDPALAQRLLEVTSGMRNTVAQEIVSETNNATIAGMNIIRIPVVVHIVYNTTTQNISDAQVLSQIDVLNQEFRKKHKDTANIPAIFKSRAADCYIEFSLATVTPKGDATNGIVRKKTSYNMFGLDDKVKSSNTGGDDAWDSDKYLNIWVCNTVTGLNGYSSVFGGPKAKDGIVLRYEAFGTQGAVVAPTNKGRTAVHELGHWMGLKHIWGDQTCGNDGIDDTPAQSAPTRGCPTGTVVSCTNAGVGNMYNNYMDLTNDECTNMFTLGQREKMRSAFAVGAPHYALLNSTGASAVPMVQSSSVVTAETSTAVKNVVQLYPNPATSAVTLDVTKDESLLGKFVTIHNQIGQQVMQIKIAQTHTVLNISSLKEGMYFVKVPTQARTFKLIKSGSSINP